EFERTQPLRPDPLTGWNGSGDTDPQVRLSFAGKDAAIAYCDRHGLQYHIVAAAPVGMKIQAYADNFR
ncbi:MAG: NADH dehydrogenase ubiquinone Fe-S protein 4, partial [Sphingomicrobium sp.]